jgi:hypothetical protein
MFCANRPETSAYSECQYYDFKNIFAEKIDENFGVFFFLFNNMSVRGSTKRIQLSLCAKTVL